MTSKPYCRRRGIILLAIISILTMFMLIGVTYIVVSGHFKNAATTDTRANEIGVPPKKQIDDVLHQLLRDVNSGNSYLRDKSLLADLYGKKGKRCSATITDVPPNAVGPSDIADIQITFEEGEVRYMYDLLGKLITLSPKVDLPPMTFRISSVARSTDNINRFDVRAILTSSISKPLIDFEGVDGFGIINGRAFSGNAEALNEPFDIPPEKEVKDEKSDPLLTFLKINPSGDIVNAVGSVDNDNDSKPDSEWRDLDFPVQTDSEGNRIKPFAAIMVQDLDGRLNLNAHSNLVHLEKPPGTGIGFGPAEINLKSTLTSELKDLLIGRRYIPGDDRRRIPGRYSSPALHRSGQRHPFSQPEDTLEYSFPRHGSLDLLTRYELHGFPSQFDTASTQSGIPNLFQTVPDLHGENTISLSQWGMKDHTAFGWNLDFRQDLLPQAPNTVKDLRIGNPYAVNLNRPTGVDSLFSAKDLEFVLRSNDLAQDNFEKYIDTDGDNQNDAKRAYHQSNQTIQRSRLEDLLPDTLGEGDRFKHLLTTHSFDVPTYHCVISEKLRQAMAGAGIVRDELLAEDTNILSLLHAHMLLADPEFRQLGSFTEQCREVENLARVLLPYELLADLPFDINKPFGSGVDTNGNQVVDEQGDSGQSPLSSHEYRQRIKFAKHLYVLALLVKDPDYHVNEVGARIPTPSSALDKLTKTALAQWAINVVDFRDKDTIMTPFEFDLNPFDGWDVDDRIDVEGTPDANTDDTKDFRGLVWGCERPELLITETFAYHDRRVEDLEYLDGDGNTQPPNMVNDQQRLKPQSGFFIELFNPWKKISSTIPRELKSSVGIDLGKTAPDSQDPIWRIIVADPPDNNDDITEYENRKSRAIYFTNPTEFLNANANQATSKDYYPEVIPNGYAGPISILPGGFTVIGSANHAPNLVGPQDSLVNEDPLDGVFKNPIGRKTIYSGDEEENPALVYNETQHLEIKYGPGGFKHRWKNLGGELTNIDPWEFLQNNSSLRPRPKLNFIPIFGIPINRSRQKGKDSLSISEPIAGYTGDNFVYRDQRGFKDGAYDPVKPFPLDNNNAELDVNERYIYLERLANPLVKYEKNTNPYIMVDYAESKIHEFMGLGHGEQGEPIHDGDLTTISRGDRGGIRTNDKASDNFRNHWQSVFQDHYPEPVPEKRLINHYFNGELRSSLGWFNTTYDANVEIDADAEIPFMHLAWHNRPFVNQFELMQVPYQSSANLLRWVMFKDQSDIYNNENDPIRRIYREHNHLINFFDSDNDLPSLNFDRLLHLTYVPSKFTGTAAYKTKKEFYYMTNSGDVLPGLTHRFWSHYREPGKINLNTIPDTGNQEVEKSLIDQKRILAATLEKITLRPPYARVKNPLEDSLLAGNDNLDLRRPRLKNISENESRRSSYFSDLGFSRLAQLTTSRSNVYAIWITLGYFEVNSNGGRVKEVGVLRGEAKRHRAFFIIDRSIPVGFEPGVNHNVDETILLRRYIE